MRILKYFFAPYYVVYIVDKELNICKIYGLQFHRNIPTKLAKIQAEQWRQKNLPNSDRQISEVSEKIERFWNDVSGKITCPSLFRTSRTFTRMMPIIRLF